MILYLIRHGESAFNAEGRIQGQTDVALSSRGVQQSHALAAALAHFPIDAIYSSPLQRARQTAQPLADKLRLPLRIEDRLKEIHAGVFQGKTWQQVAADYPAEATRWAAHEPDFVIPGGESRRQLGIRGHAALAAIRNTNLKHVAVIAHGGVLTAALKELLHISYSQQPRGLLNASISKLAWDDEIELLTINEIDHLSTLDGEALIRAGDL